MFHIFVQKHKIMNPFIIRGYDGKAFFCDRETETRKIVEAVKNQRSITLTSIRKMGKTGLIRHVAETLQTDQIHLAYLDILGTQDLNSFINQFGSAIFKLKQPLSKKIPRLFNSFVKNLRPTINYDALTGQPSLTFSMENQQKSITTLEEIFGYLNKISERNPIVVAIDEFQQIANYPEENVEALLRKNIQFLPNVQFIFSGSNKHVLINMFADVKRPFYQSTQFMLLREIPEASYSEFIRHHFEKHNKTITDEAVQYILENTRRHTWYVQFLCNSLFGAQVKKTDLKQAESVLKQILLENEPYYFEYRNLITTQQWNLLIALARENGIREITTGEFIKTHNLTNAATVKRGIESLLQKELVCEIDEKYYVYDVFLSLWLSQKF